MSHLTQPAVQLINHTNDIGWGLANNPVYSATQLQRPAVTSLCRRALESIEVNGLNSAFALDLRGMTVIGTTGWFYVIGG